MGDIVGVRMWDELQTEMPRIFPSPPTPTPRVELSVFCFVYLIVCLFISLHAPDCLGICLFD